MTDGFSPTQTQPAGAARDERAGAPRRAGIDLLARAALIAALATGLELAVRLAAPIPYAPRPSDLALTLLFYLVLAAPAVAAGWLVARLPALPRHLLAAPFGLLAANLTFAFGARSAASVGVLALVGLGGGVLVCRFPARLLAAVTALSLAFAAAVRLGGGVRAADTSEPCVLLVVLDTTAVSHLTAYGYGRPTSPHLAALARRGLLYRRALAAAPWTLPSHASIFSGHYPSELGFEGWHLDERAAGGSIAGDLAARGLHGAAISANPIIPAMGALRAGFERSWGVESLGRPLLLKVLDRLLHRQAFQSHGSQVTDLALDWLDRLSPRREPWFLFVNYLDPHAPYRPPRREREEFAPGIDPAMIAEDMETYNSGRLPLTPEVMRAMRALYDGEIASEDAALGRLLAALERRGYTSTNLLVIVTADHGEGLGENGFVGHLLGMTDSLLHVPLILAGPGVEPGEISTPVQLVQLRATVRTLLGLGELSGIAPPLPPWGPAPTLLIAEHPEPGWYLDELRGFNPALDPARWQGNWTAVERDGIKVVFDDRGRGATYDLRADPGERSPRPLADGATLMEQYATWRGGTAVASPRALSEETRRALEAIGYLH